MNALDVWGGSRGEHPLAAAERLFRRMAGERLDILNSAWVRIDNDRTTSETLADICSVAHKIAGTAASLGHPVIGHFAAKVEQLSIDQAPLAELQAALRPLMSALAELTED